MPATRKPTSRGRTAWTPRPSAVLEARLPRYPRRFSGCWLSRSRVSKWPQRWHRKYDRARRNPTGSTARANVII